MNYYSFRGKFNDLIKSYLNNRKQFVSINGYDSTKLDVTCGVPQGSTLGPLLFLLYINDLQNSLKFAKSSHFADDTCLTYSNKHPKTLESNLNYDHPDLCNFNSSKILKNFLIGFFFMDFILKEKCTWFGIKI